ncbi:amino acid permease [bacterium]|nr:amino acid permease [bacterium]MBU1064103.1 amino acid permease [bacterium]MBU1634485.1 amino acid permease [bacterium]MBU1872231.1 amino acid permease [bacterium]
MILKRELNIWHVIALILGSVIGSGVFINLPIVAREAGSPWLAVMAWLIGGIIWLPQLFILAEMATAYPEEGFGYLYLKKAGSPALGFLYVWTVFWTSDTPSITIIALSAVTALSIFWGPLAGTLYTKLFAMLLIMILTYVHYRSVRKGGGVQIILTIAKLSPLILLCILGVSLFNAEHLFAAPQNPVMANKGMITLLVAGVAGTIWSYAGFTNVLYMAGEMKNPQKIIPRSLLISVGIVTLVYTLIALSTSVFIPHDELIATSGQFANPFLYLPAFAKIAGAFLAIAAFISMIGCVNALIMVQPRIEYAIARDGLFFKTFAHVHPKYQTPDYSILLQSGLAIVLLFVGGIEALLGYFTLSYLLQNGMVYSAIFFLRKRDDYKPTFKSPAWLLMAIVAIASQMYLIYGTFIAFPLGGVLSAVILIATGLPMYYYFKYRQLQAK